MCILVHDGSVDACIDMYSVDSTSRNIKRLVCCRALTFIEQRSFIREKSYNVTTKETNDSTND